MLKVNNLLNKTVIYVSLIFVLIHTLKYFVIYSKFVCIQNIVDNMVIAAKQVLSNNGCDLNDIM